MHYVVMAVHAYTSNKFPECLGVYSTKAEAIDAVNSYLDSVEEEDGSFDYSRNVEEEDGKYMVRSGTSVAGVLRPLVYCAITPAKVKLDTVGNKG